MSTCNRLNLQTLGSQPVLSYAQKSPGSLGWPWKTLGLYDRSCPKPSWDTSHRSPAAGWPASSVSFSVTQLVLLRPVFTRFLSTVLTALWRRRLQFQICQVQAYKFSRGICLVFIRLYNGGEIPPSVESIQGWRTNGTRPVWLGGR